MDQIEVKCGKPTFIEEINSVTDPATLVGKSVSVVGRLTMHEVGDCLAKLTDPSVKADIFVDTTLVEPFEARIGSMFFFIGELESGRDGIGVVLKARVVRCAEGLDLALYRKAIEAQRFFLDNRG
ncbi:Telomeric pathways with STn1 [Mactra antiquata]